MSSRASAGIPLNLPDRLRADRVADALVLLAAVVTGWVAAAHGSVGWGVLLASGMSLAAMLARRRPLRGAVEIDAQAEVRRLGPSLVVAARPGDAMGRPRTLWLLGGDVPATVLRRACLRLRAGRAEVGS